MNVESDVFLGKGHLPLGRMGNLSSAGDVSRMSELKAKSSIGIDIAGDRKVLNPFTDADAMAKWLPLR
jgi:hypothetical protein